jgi:tail tube protein
MKTYLIASTALVTPARAFDAEVPRAPLNHQNGSLTSLYAAEEASPGVLPDGPVWEEREPNSYANFGGAFTMSRRNPLSHDRQARRGEVSDNSPTAEYQEDFTPTNMIRPMRSFLFAEARQRPSTAPINQLVVVVTHTTAAQFHAAAGLDRFRIGHILKPRGFAEASTNAGIRVVTAAGALTATVAPVMTPEPDSPESAVLEAVGFQFSAGDLTLTRLADGVVLTTDMAGVDFTTMGFVPGEWHFIGGDTAATRFAEPGNDTTSTNAPFYAQLDTVTANALAYRKTTGVQVTNDGAGKTIQIFFGTVVRNEDDCDLIKEITFTHERQYGCGIGAEAEYVQGDYANQMTITVPTPAADAKVTVDLGFIGLTSFERTEDEPLLSDGEGHIRVPALNEPCFKPGMDVYQQKLSVLDPTTLNPSALVAYSSTSSITINNQLTGIKAVETFGNAGVSIGELMVSGSITAFWTGVHQNRQVRLGKEATWHLILTKANATVILDIASLSLGNGRNAVAANTPVTIPLDTAAAKGKHGYSLLVTFLRYVPTVGMANAS